MIATGSPSPALTFTGTPPGGPSFVDNANETATLWGAPAAGTAKNYTLQIMAKNRPGSATQIFTLVVKP